MPISIQSGSRVQIRTDALWNYGKRTTAAATYVAKYVPSASAKREARARILEEIERLAAEGKDYSQLDPDAPDYSRWVTFHKIDMWFYLIVSMLNINHFTNIATFYIRNRYLIFIVAWSSSKCAVRISAISEY
jgi:hypothetical protein